MNDTAPSTVVRCAIRRWIVTLSLCLYPWGVAWSQTLFTASGVAAAPAGSGGCASFSDSSSTLASGHASGGPCEVIANIGSVAAIASAGGQGASASLRHFCCGTSSSSSAIARADSVLRIDGPAGTVAVSLNLVLQSGGDRGSSVAVAAQQFGSGRVTSSLGGVLSRSDQGVFIPDVDCNPCAITTKTISLATNTDHFFRLQLDAAVTSGPDNYTGQTDAMGGGLRFPIAAPVFNLPAGYTASIEGLGVVDNRWVTPVPEPQSAALLALGLLGIAARRAAAQNRK